VLNLCIVDTRIHLPLEDIKQHGEESWVIYFAFYPEKIAALHKNMTFF